MTKLELQRQAPTWTRTLHAPPRPIASCGVRLKCSALRPRTWSDSAHSAGDAPGDETLGRTGLGGVRLVARDLRILRWEPLLIPGWRTWGLP